MKRLLLLILLPSLLQASDKDPDYTNGQKAALAATCATSWTASAYTGAIGGTKIATSLFAGDILGAGMAAFGLLSTEVSIINATSAAVDHIEGKPVGGSPLEIAAAQSTMRKTIAQNNAATDLTTCLNTHAHNDDLHVRGIPKRCMSPARRLAMLNEAETDRIVTSFLKFSQGRTRKVTL